MNNFPLNPIVIDPSRFSAHGVTVKDTMMQAHNDQLFAYFTLVGKPADLSVVDTALDALREIGITPLSVHNEKRISATDPNEWTLIIHIEPPQHWQR